MYNIFEFEAKQGWYNNKCVNSTDDIHMDSCNILWKTKMERTRDIFTYI